VIGGVAGLADFWKWEYDYGHDLDPHAAIQIPGMSYQPPLIGTRQLLNMRTTALPGAGAIAVMLSLGLGAWVFHHSRRDADEGQGGDTPERGARSRNRTVDRAVSLLPLVLLLGGCSGGPRPIAYGTDACERCRMFVVDDRHGAQLVTRRGRVLVFDSVECLAAHMHTAPGDAEGARAALVTHALRPGQLVDASGSRFLQCEALPSPMGLGLSACASADEAESLRARHGGQVLDWAGMQAFVLQAWKLP
jgi:copper chaperone NosL